MDFQSKTTFQGDISRGWKTKSGRSHNVAGCLYHCVYVDSGIYHMCDVKVCVVLLHFVDIQNIFHDLLGLNVIVILCYSYDPE